MRALIKSPSVKKPIRSHINTTEIESNLEWNRSIQFEWTSPVQRQRNLERWPKDREELARQVRDLTKRQGCGPKE